MHWFHFRRKRTDRIDADDIRSAIKSVKKASKVTSNAMIYHQAYLQQSAISNNWDLGPLQKKIREGLANDSSDDTDDETEANLKVSKEEYKRLMEGIQIPHTEPFHLKWQFQSVSAIQIVQLEK